MLRGAEQEFSAESTVDSHQSTGASELPVVVVGVDEFGVGPNTLTAHACETAVRERGLAEALRHAANCVVGGARERAIDGRGARSSIDTL
jgi:hypothetical protein